MATFQVQVEDLTGSIGDTTAISSWLQDGCKEVINFIPKIRLEEVASTTVFENTIDVEGKKVLGVLRKDAGNSSYLTPCRKVAPTKKGIIQDSTNMEYATTSDPAYWMDGDTLQVFPTSASTNDMSLVHISLDFSAVTYDDSSITNFPDEAEPAVVLYAARNGIQRLMNDLHSNSDITTALSAANTELDELPDIADLINAEVDLAKVEAAELATQTDNAGAINTALAAIATELNKVDEIILLAHEEFDEVAAEVSSTATSPITQARSAMPSALSLSDLNVTVPSPEKPTLTTVSYSDATNADASATSVGAITVAAVSKADISGDVPTYTKPTLSLSSVAISDLSISASAPTVPTLKDVIYIGATNENASASSQSATTFGSVPNEVDVSGNAPTFTPPVLDLDITQFETFLETDEDSELAQIQLGRLNNEVAEYQAKLAESQANFNKENALYQTEFQESIAKFQADQQKVLEQSRLDLSKAQQDAQNSTNVDLANKAKDQELAIQNSINSMQEIINDNNNKLAKFQQELGLYQQNINKEIAQYQQNTQKELTLYGARTGVELQEFGQNIQNELNEFNKENVRYQANVAAETQKHNSDLQKAITQAQLDAADAQQEAQQATQVDLANKAQDQVLALQNSIQNMQAKVQDNSDKLQKFNGELQEYATSINKEVQEYTNNLQQNVAEYQSSLAIAGSYYQEAQARVNAGNAFLGQAQAVIGQAQGYASEVSARIGFSGAKAQAVQAYLNTAQGYMVEMQSKIGTSGGYLQEVQGRFSIDTARYGWYTQQYQMIDAQYKEFLQSLQGAMAFRREN
tara:strand:- start:3936 stop:6365 length:2430 start_codon:yes stop_codon:yes gene_type:complete